ncbi:MAG TPA: hypothetical protein VGG27_06720 [Magnetospirillaceae bacterium]|jgi:hypothetical protein
MKIRFVPLDTAFAGALWAEDPGQAARWLSLASSEPQATLGWGVADDERPIAAFGIRPQWHGRAIAWLAPAPNVRLRHFAAIGAFCIGWFDTLQRNPAFARIEGHAPVDQPKHGRWLERMGFEPEALMRRWMPDGGDAMLYARIAEHA